MGGSWARMLVAPVMLASTVSPAAAAPAGRVLDGHWAGGGFEIRIDVERGLANIDPEKPFSWQRFIVKDVEGTRIVFTIGARLFIAELSEDGMALTGFDFPGEIQLTRQREEAPAAVEAVPFAEELRPGMTEDSTPGEEPG